MAPAIIGPFAWGPFAWGLLGWACCGVGVEGVLPASGACWVGGGMVAVPADWVVTVVSSGSSTVGMGSPGAGSRCWMGWPDDGVCCTGAPWGGRPACGIEARPPPVAELSPLGVPLPVPLPLPLSLPVASGEPLELWELSP
ncbi:hypothetical protein [Streptomyces decoyicus]|uniref:hypothetical protein n=1 Tax=Streptomyces decoyicus TaxID=249567 RepID=UPI00380EDCBB